MSNDSSLWAFCLSFYRQPGVEALCLKFQDEQDINVNHVLWALWLDQCTPGGDETLWQQGIHATDIWHRWVVVNLRAARRRLSKHGVWASLRKQLLRWELLAERRELQSLERVTFQRLQSEWESWQPQQGICPPKTLATLLSRSDCDALMGCFERWCQTNLERKEG